MGKLQVVQWISKMIGNGKVDVHGPACRNFSVWKPSICQYSIVHLATFVCLYVSEGHRGMGSVSL